MSIATNLAKTAQEFRNLSKRASEDPTPDRVHDLRVLTRRIRADLWLVPPSLRTRAIRRSRSELRKLARQLGEQRKYDVAREDAIRFKRETKEIMERLKVARSDVARALTSKKRKRYRTHINRAVSDANRISASSYIPRIETLKKELVRSRNHPPITGSARHHLRIEVKKARYLLQALGRDVPSLNSLQEHLGRWHDLTVLSGLTGHPRELVKAKEREWKKAKRSLDSTLSKTIDAISFTTRKLRS